RAAQLLVCAAGGDTSAIEQLLPSLTDSDPVMRRSALAGLLKYGRVPGVLRAGERVLALVQSPEAADRAMAAAVVGDAGIPNFHQVLSELMDDPDDGVRLAALRAAGALKHLRLWPQVVRHLALNRFWQAASMVLAAAGDDPVPAIEDILFDPDFNRRTRIRAV